HADVRRAGIEVRRLDAGDRAPCGHAGHVLTHIGPVTAAIAGIPNLAVVGAGPDQALLNLRRGNGEDHLAIELAAVIADQAARGDDAARIVRGKIRADDATCLARVGRLEDYLAAVIDGVVIEGINGERGGPMAAVLGLVRGGIERVNPRADRARHFRLRVPTSHFVAIAGGPDDIGI